MPRPAPLLWALFTVPAAFLVVEAASAPAMVEDLLHPSGEWSARFLVAALALTPLARLWPPARRALPHRRALGLAAFGYAALHLILYISAMGTLDDMLAELGATGIWTGWLAFAFLIPLALTSHNAAMRALGRAWKQLQRLAYPAALFTLAHWVAVHDGWAAALAHFVPLALLEISRLVPKSLQSPLKGASNA